MADFWQTNKHYGVAFLTGMVCVFLVLAPIGFVQQVFGLGGLEDNAAFGTILQLLLLAVFFVSGGLAFAKSRKDAIRSQEAEASRRRVELAELREQVKKEVLDELRKDSTDR